MAEKEGRLPVSSILALIVGLLLIVSTTLPFITFESTWVSAPHRILYSSSGLAIATGDPRLGMAGYSLVYLIPIGGIVGMLSASITVVPKMKPKARVYGLPLLVGGYLAQVGGIMTLIQLGPVLDMMLANESINVGIGLLGALILGTVEIIVGATIILRKET